ncbi:MAG TPA: MFS transporter, partial [Acidobacteriaceae bacterium]|nr:MFS transporter [Acidobacteriaceae bacterium]
MASAKAFLKSGHPMTLFASFLYFDFSFAVWVLNGAMGPFISEQFHLSPAQIGLMVSIPTLAGALMRFPLGVLSQYIGRKNAAIVEMSCIIVALGYGFFFVHSFSNLIAMGVLLGSAGASFGVALSLGAGWFPREYKGLAMGIAGAGNSGTAIAAFFAPRLAKTYGWSHVYGIAALCMLLPLFVMIVFAKEPPDTEHQTLRQHLQCLFEADGWYFNLIYIITFGGFLGLATFLPSLFVSQFHIAKSQAGTFTMMATLVGSGTRVLGGWFADRVGGITTLSVVFLLAIAGIFGLVTSPSLAVTVTLFMLCFAALGA